MKRLVAMLTGFAAAIIAAAPSSATQYDEFTLPFKLTSSGHIVVDVTLGETTESRAIFDTGANFTLVGRKTGAIFGAQAAVDPRMVSVVGLGVTGEYPVVDLEGVSFGGYSVGQVPAAYNEQFRLSGTDTVLPANLLPHQTLDFDFERSHLRAYDRRPDRIYRSTVSRLPIRWINGLPFVEVKVNGKRGIALIDTGANSTMIGSAFANSASRSAKDLRIVELTGATGEVVPISVLSGRRFQIGKFEISRFQVVVVDPAFLEEFGLEDEPVMIMGLDILKQFRVQVDRKNDEVRISQPLAPGRLPEYQLYYD